MLLHFTFVPGGWTRRPWRLLRGGRRPARGGRRPTSPSPSPPRAASDRRPWGSGSALGRESAEWGGGRGQFARKKTVVRLKLGIAKHQN